MKRALEGSVVVVTGAASGIGRATALEFARRKAASVAISDVDEAGLDETRAALEALGSRAHSRRLDVSDRAAVFAYADEVAAELGAPNVVINNAGVSAVNTIRDFAIEDIEWVMGINFWGVVYGTKAFLPHLEQAAWGHVANISSVFGIIAVPTQGAYNASKFAVRGFTECLRQELELAGSTVSATSVHPGGIATNIARNARYQGAEALVGTKEQSVKHFDKLARTTPEAAARRIVKAVERNHPRALIGPDAHLIDIGQRMMPLMYRRANRILLGK